MRVKRQNQILEIWYAGLLNTRAWRVGTTHCVFQFGNGTWGGRRVGSTFSCCSGRSRSDVEEIINDRECHCYENKKR